ncbi:hypothetical protein PHYSODRAFT_298302 [Phytophthora sojae]|uniref:RxLR effector protein n=1 Tax=Phytophthora sojae (strain P6497) TaxID=1094619 RepID=G4Z2E1_PHYSP|nr:hypothetical protein PHYSODRAFT_298302 [Phytophthora sojae]EGZ19982.1 hypothetical protein PHYSODRAFT_298302 [Phytophthora sojae]|eukprot:XP_009522699.1 hypothetical protein PHYSODRAFT_298302 [Phytophthora sojae]
MRLSWILLAAAVALAATPVSGASDLSLTESVQSGKRFFRSTESNNKHQQDTELDLTGEERGPDVVKPLLKLKVPAKPLLTIEIPKVKASVKAPQLSIYRVAEDMMGPLTPEKLNTVRLFIEKQVKNNQVAKKIVQEFVNEKWTPSMLRKNLGITRGTPKTSEEYQAYIALVQVRSYNTVQRKTGVALSLPWKPQVKTL